MRERDAHVGFADVEQRERGRARLRGGLRHRVREPREGARSHGGEQLVEAREVVVRRRVRDPGGLRELAQRERLEAALVEPGLGGVEQRLAQVAVVVGARRRAAPGCG